MKKQEKQIIDPKLTEMFKQSYDLTKDFVEDVAVLPVLRLVYPAQGEDPKIIDGKPHRKIDEQMVPLYSYYHSGTKKFYENPEVVIVGNKKTKLPAFINKSRLQYTEVVGGFILKDKAPFIMFFKSLALSPWWELHKELANASRDTGIPVHGLKVKLTHILRSSLDGKFKNLKTQAGEYTGDYITDPELFSYITDHVVSVKEGLKAYVSRKTDNEPDPGYPQSGVANYDSNKGEYVDVDDIPV